MGIIYLISVIILFTTFILVKKTDKKIDIISFVATSIVILFCYNVFVCYVLTFFTIPIKLSLLTLINTFISIYLIFLIIKNKQIQKYSFNKFDIVYILIIAIVVLIVSYLNFGYPFNVNYETGDPSVHYLTSVIFAESDALLTGQVKDQVHGTFEMRKTGSYVNSGLLMKSLSRDFYFRDCYNIFVSFGIFVLFATGVVLFSAMKTFAKTKEHTFIAFLLSLICILGYPLNSLLFGFEYLSMGLLMICGILNLINYYDAEVFEMKFFIPIMGLMSFGLFSSYYMFVPYIYSALWIYFCIKNYRKTNKKITKELIITLLVTLIVPFILGFIYHLESDIYTIFIKQKPRFFDLLNGEIFAIILIVSLLIIFVTRKMFKKNNLTIKNKIKKTKNIKTLKRIGLICGIFLIALILFIKRDMFLSFANNNDIFRYSAKVINKVFARDGYTYVNIYSNMILLIPLTIYLFIKDTTDNKLKNNLFLGLLLELMIIFLIVLFIGHKYEKVSIYYLLKNYYVLWILLFYCNYKALMLLYENNKWLPRILISLYTILMIVCTMFSNVEMGYIVRGTKEKVVDVMDVFGANKTIILNKPIEFDQEELKILEYAEKNWKKEAKVEIIADENSYYWQYAFFRKINKEGKFKNKAGGQDELTAKWENLEKKINNVDYMIVFTKSKPYKKLKNKLFENAEIIYANNSGGILRYKK